MRVEVTKDRVQVAVVEITGELIARLPGGGRVQLQAGGPLTRRVTGELPEHVVDRIVDGLQLGHVVGATDRCEWREHPTAP